MANTHSTRCEWPNRGVRSRKTLRGFNMFYKNQSNTHWLYLRFYLRLIMFLLYLTHRSSFLQTRFILRLCEVGLRQHLEVEQGQQRLGGMVSSRGGKYRGYQHIPTISRWMSGATQRVEVSIDITEYDEFAQEYVHFLLGSALFINCVDTVYPALLGHGKSWGLHWHSVWDGLEHIWNIAKASEKNSAHRVEG